ncbi:MAG: DPP IV N-terminal domain-containing protein [Bacillota bacterium]|jgi:dipeptidyl-peptidase-4
MASCAESRRDSHAEENPSVTFDDYARAERFLPSNIQKILFGLEAVPRWIDEGDCFWYKFDTRQGKRFVFVDPTTGKIADAFDHVRLAAALSLASGTACGHDKLPFDEITWRDGRTKVAFKAGSVNWLCDLETYQIVKEDVPCENPEEVLSPDGKYAAFVRDYNVYVRVADTGEEIQLTTDGQERFGYGQSAVSPLVTAGLVSEETRAMWARPIIHWSPDSRKILTFQLDNRNVKECYLIQSVPLDGSKRPLLHRYPYVQPGDEAVSEVSAVVLDVERRKTVRAKMDPMMDIYYAGMQTWVYWTKGPKPRVYFAEATRMYRSARLHMMDPETGDTKCLFEDTAPPTGDKFHIAQIGDAQEFLWVSQRDNWAHIYLYDGVTGELKRQVTSGPWVVRGIARVDETNRIVYFEAGGREDGRDPYYRHLYSVGLDGGEIRLLTPEDAEHQVTFSPSGGYFVDTYSRIDLPPVHVVRKASGEMVCKLGEADISLLLETGWKYPERFSAKARDGVTDIYGMVIRPSNFDPTRKYPVIEANYSGPQTIRTPKAFGGGMGSSKIWYDQALAELGFIVVTVDGLGMAYRSKSFQDFAYKNLGDAGLDDHIAAFWQLADRYPYMDLSRVGIYGSSAGGYASTHAIMARPDFYKVAVSWAGNHDHRTDKAAWNERYMGPLGPHYEEQANSHLAANLKGKLLIMHGDMDENVPPASSVQLIDALIKANKDFDYLVLPNAPHAYGMHPYIVRKRWDYFVKHLLGVEPPREYPLFKV